MIFMASSSATFATRRLASRRLPGELMDNSYSREVFGGDVGGALKKDKLFYFLSGEYFKQDLNAPVVFNAPFDVIKGSYDAPFHAD